RGSGRRGRWRRHRPSRSVRRSGTGRDGGVGLHEQQHADQSMTNVETGYSGIGASVPRKEDDRYLRGKGEFVAGIRLPGMQELTFVRSPVAHARLRHVRKPKGAEAAVFTAEDLVGVGPIVANSRLPGFKSSEQPVLATSKLRYVGEPVAVCVAADRAT